MRMLCRHIQSVWMLTAIVIASLAIGVSIGIVVAVKFHIACPNLAGDMTDELVSEIRLHPRIHVGIHPDGNAVIGLSGITAKEMMRQYKAVDRKLFNSYLLDCDSNVLLRANIAYLLIASENKQYLEYNAKSTTIIPQEEQQVLKFYSYRPPGELDISESFAKRLAEIYEEKKSGGPEKGTGPGRIPGKQRETKGTFCFIANCHQNIVSLHQ